MNNTKNNFNTKVRFKCRVVRCFNLTQLHHIKEVILAPKHKMKSKVDTVLSLLFILHKSPMASE